MYKNGDISNVVRNALAEDNKITIGTKEIIEEKASTCSFCGKNIANSPEGLCSACYALRTQARA